MNYAAEAACSTLQRLTLQDSPLRNDTGKRNGVRLNLSLFGVLHSMDMATSRSRAAVEDKCKTQQLQHPDASPLRPNPQTPRSTFHPKPEAPKDFPTPGAQASWNYFWDNYTEAIAAYFGPDPGMGLGIRGLCSSICEFVVVPRSPCIDGRLGCLRKGRIVCPTRPRGSSTI